MRHLLHGSLLLVVVALSGCGVSARYGAQLDQQEERAQIVEKTIGDLQLKLDSLDRKIANLEARLTDVERYLNANPIGNASYAPVTPIRFPKKDTSAVNPDRKK